MDWETVSFVFSSELRLKTLMRLNKSQFTPTQMAETFNAPISHISKVLKELQEKELVMCLTPSRKKARFYAITKSGREVLDEINKIGKR